MEELLEKMKYILDVRQERKVCHKLKDIWVIVLFATLANVDDWVEMELFAKEHHPKMKSEYIENARNNENRTLQEETICNQYLYKIIFGKDFIFFKKSSY